MKRWSLVLVGALMVLLVGSTSVDAQRAGPLPEVRRRTAVHNNCAHDPIGDVNGDGVVGIHDFSILATAYYSRAGEAQYDARADMNCDGAVGYPDFLILELGYRLRDMPENDRLP